MCKSQMERSFTIMQRPNVKQFDRLTHGSLVFKAVKSSVYLAPYAE